MQTSAAPPKWPKPTWSIYTPTTAQEIAAQHFYRPRSKSIADKYAAQFPKLNLFTINDVFGGWQNAQKTHFADGGIFDQIYGK